MLGGGILSVITRRAASGSIPLRLSNGFPGVLGAGVKAGFGGWGRGRLGFVEQRLLGGWGRRSCRTTLRLLLRLGCRGRRRRLRCRLRRSGRNGWAGSFHGLQLLQGLAIERRVGRLSSATLVRR